MGRSRSRPSPKKPSVHKKRNNNGHFRRPPQTPQRQQRPPRHSLQSVARSELLSATHGRLRRRQRNIRKIDLQCARRYGMEEDAHYGRLKYTHAGRVFIYDPHRNREVTSWRIDQQYASGSHVVAPISLPYQRLTDGQVRQHAQQKQGWQQCSGTTLDTHVVMVVDLSGSMRRDDVNGARCRSDAVFLALARDFVKDQMEHQHQQCAVTLVGMRDRAECILFGEPLDAVLYNQMIDLREWRNLRPAGQGNYLPALQEAGRSMGWKSARSVVLLFFSDGRPSDNGRDKLEAIHLEVQKMAQRFGKRLSMSFIGLADKKEDFSVLKSMAATGKKHGAILSHFEQPSLHTHALSDMLSHLSSNLTSTLSSLVQSGPRRTIRTDFVRELRLLGPVNDGKRPNPQDWKIYGVSSQDRKDVMLMWTWSPQHNDMIYLKDSRCIFCHRTVKTQKEAPIQTCGNQCAVPGRLCSKCNVCMLCDKCYRSNFHRETDECMTYLENRRRGELTEKRVPSFSVALRKQVFGTGAERIVRRVRFLDDRGEFVGNPFVAKESLYVEDEAPTNRGQDNLNEYRERHLKFQTEFMRAQNLAQQCAVAFNTAMANMTDVDSHWLRTMPRFRFLEPLVVELMDSDETIRKVLIEEYLPGRYRKFNSNSGLVFKHGRPINRRASVAGALPSVAEDREVIVIKEEEDAPKIIDIDDSDEEDEVIPMKVESGDENDRNMSNIPLALPYRNEPVDTKQIDPADFPQVFSHYTYEASKKQFIVVDIQGNFVQNSDGTCEYILTDPAIHHNRRGRSSVFSRLGSLGRTNTGKKGMKAFFASHKCTESCRLFGLKPQQL